MPAPEDVLRTPEERFSDLSEFPYEPQYQQIDDEYEALRMHYVDEGPADQPVVLLLHGEPTWSFLYRKVIDRVVAAGYRAVAPDQIGFGRSDKLKAREDYSYQQYVDWMREFVQALELDDITLVCQDWGGPIGLRVLSELPESFDGVIATNTLLPNHEPPPRGVTDWPADGTKEWVATAREADDLPISQAIADTTIDTPSEDVLAAYDAPFPNPSYKAAALEFPCLIPVEESMPGVEANWKTWSFLDNFEKPFLTAFSDSDPTTKAWERVFQKRVSGAKDQPHLEIAGAGHFVQEEKGRKFGSVVVDHLQRQHEDE